MHKFVLFSLVLISLASCTKTNKDKYYPASSSNFQYQGRIKKLNDSTITLIGSASNIHFAVEGDSCQLFFSGVNQSDYVSLELNSKYIGRFNIKNSPIQIGLKDSLNDIKIYKATEASTGDIFFNGVKAEKISKAISKPRKKIEFIGNSITCGMGADMDSIDCGSENWFDQHNSYLAYGPRIARILDVDFELSCVSGMGMYRNWNDEDQPVMPDVYDFKNLSDDGERRAKPEHSPDIISVALGTNDLSKGDGIKERSEFNHKKFERNYIKFLNHLHKIYPQAKFTLLTSPMVDPESKEGKELLESLRSIKSKLNDELTIEIFEFKLMQPEGCAYHPSSQDHKILAQQLVPFFKNILSSKS